MIEAQLIRACKEGDRMAQKKLYELMAAKMFGLCRRYIKEEADVEDVLLKGFYKMFNKLEQYSGEGNFEGWVRKIMVNEALMFLRKQKSNIHLHIATIEDEAYRLPDQKKADEALAENEILKLLDLLPDGYRTVFNLYAIEGYSHKEIAEQLEVSINTSKSQLLKARRMLQDLINKREQWKTAG